MEIHTILSKNLLCYLVEISQENYCLLLGGFEDIFAEIEQKINDLTELLFELQEESEHEDDRGMNVQLRATTRMTSLFNRRMTMTEVSLTTQWIVKELTFTERWIEI